MQEKKGSILQVFSIENHRQMGREMSSVKPRVMTPQSSVSFPKTHLKAAQNSAKYYKKRVMRAVFALPPAALASAAYQFMHFVV